jgi:hypothetical protein
VPLFIDFSIFLKTIVVDVSSLLTPNSAGALLHGGAVEGDQELQLPLSLLVLVSLSTRFKCQKMLLPAFSPEHVIESRDVLVRVVKFPLLLQELRENSKRGGGTGKEERNNQQIHLHLYFI